MMKWLGVLMENTLKIIGNVDNSDGRVNLMLL